MIEVHHNLFVGSEADEALVRGQSGWFVVHACKEPYHRQALGYQGRAAAKDHPEYLIARRPGRLVLNLIDANDVNFIPAEIIDTALSEIHQNITSAKILVHCNQGFSRAPTIAFLYILRFSDVFQRENLAQDLQDFLNIYAAYAPAQGMADYVRLNWPRYSSRA